jgi:hypothetical protein
MNDGGYRVPGRDVDATAIEQEKIRQVGETKRKLIEEKEKSRREIADKRRIRWTDNGFQNMVVFCVLIPSVALAGIGGFYFNMKTPAAPVQESGCREMSEVINVNTTTRHCGVGARLETEVMPDGHVLVRCKCFSTVGDAGHP